MLLYLLVINIPRNKNKGKRLTPFETMQRQRPNAKSNAVT